MLPAHDGSRQDDIQLRWQLNWNASMLKDGDRCRVRPTSGRLWDLGNAKPAWR